MIYKDKAFNQKNIALERIAKLFFEAEQSFREHPQLSKRYVEMARKLATRYKVKFNAEQKKLSCKKCNAYLKEGINCRVRLERGKIARTCLECGNVRRIVYRK